MLLLQPDTESNLFQSRASMARKLPLYSVQYSVHIEGKGPSKSCDLVDFPTVTTLKGSKNVIGSQVFRITYKQ